MPRLKSACGEMGPGCVYVQAVCACVAGGRAADTYTVDGIARAMEGVGCLALVELQQQLRHLVLVPLDSQLHKPRPQLLGIDQAIAVPIHLCEHVGVLEVAKRGLVHQALEGKRPAGRNAGAHFTGFLGH